MVIRYILPVIYLLFIIILSCKDNDEVNQVFNLNSIKNASYQVNVKSLSTVKLENGAYEEPNQGVFIKLNEFVVFEDFDNDGLNDAAAILNVQSGINSSIYNLAIMKNENGKPLHIASKYLGEKVQIKRIYSNDKNIYIDMQVHDIKDDICCPTKNVTRVFKLINNNSIELICSDAKDFYCFGEDPGWTLENTGKNFILKTESDVERFYYVYPRVTDDLYFYETTDFAKNKIVMEIRKENCLTHSGGSYSYSVKITKADGTILNGCATIKDFVYDVEKVKTEVAKIKNEIDNYESFTKKWNMDKDEIKLKYYKDKGEIKYIYEKILKISPFNEIKEYYFKDNRLIFYTENSLYQDENVSERKGTLKKEIEVYFNESESVIYSEKRINNISLALDVKEKDDLIRHLTEIRQILK